MRFVIYNHRIYALEEEDVIEHTGSPSQLCYDISRMTLPGRTAELECCDIKDCKNCDLYDWERKECMDSPEPTVPLDERFCKEFRWREL